MSGRGVSHSPYHRCDLIVLCRCAVSLRFVVALCCCAVCCTVFSYDCHSCLMHDVRNSTSGSKIPTGFPLRDFIESMMMRPLSDCPDRSTGDDRHNIYNDDQINDEWDDELFWEASSKRCNWNFCCARKIKSKKKLEKITEAIPCCAGMTTSPVWYVLLGECRNKGIIFSIETVKTHTVAS